MSYRNIHSHIFTMSNAPQRLLTLFLPGFVASGVDNITNTKAGSFIMQELFHAIGGPAERYASFLKIGKSRNTREVFEYLKEQYRDDQSMQYVALTMYMERCGVGSSVSGFEGQLEEILQVKKEYPERLMIFFGLDPRWKMNGTQLRKTVESYFNQKLKINEFSSVYPFCGLKLYPSTGFYVFDEKLKETFEWAADNGVPVLSHCSYLGGIYNGNRDDIEAALNPYNVYTQTAYSQPSYRKKFRFGKWLTGTNGNNNDKYACSYFLEPDTYSHVLKYFETQRNYFDRALETLDKKQRDPLKICLAHFGGDNQLKAALGIGKLDDDNKNPCGVRNMNWFNQVQDLLKNYKGAYTDVSYGVWDKNIHPAVFGETNNPDYGKRILFGTDYFMTEREQAEKETYHLFKKSALNYKLSNHGGISAWEQMAGRNTEEFLKSRYYGG